MLFIPQAIWECLIKKKEKKALKPSKCEAFWVNVFATTKVSNYRTIALISHK